MVLKAFWLVLTSKNVKWKERFERDRLIPYSNVDLQTKLCVPNLALRRRRIRGGSSGASKSTKEFHRPRWTTSLSYRMLKTCADCVYLSKNQNRRSSGHKILLLLCHSLLKYRHAYHFRFVLFFITRSKIDEIDYMLANYNVRRRTSNEFGFSRLKVMSTARDVRITQ